MQHLVSESVRRKMKQDKGKRVLIVGGGGRGTSQVKCWG